MHSKCKVASWKITCTPKWHRVLVGNKCDVDEHQRQVPVDAARKQAEEWNSPFFETSAKTKHNNAECFYEVVREIRKLNDRKLKQSEEKKPRKFFCSIL